MELVRLDKDDLLGILRENREQHRAIFEEALEGYRDEGIRLLEQHIADIRAGKVREVFIRVPRPQDHTSDYDRVIRMLEMSQDDVIEVSEQDFRSYVMDDWAWKQDFLVSNRMYSKTASDTLEAMNA